jgi:hypothetical protein
MTRHPARLAAVVASAWLAACSSSANGPGAAQPEGGAPDTSVEHGDGGPADHGGGGRCVYAPLTSRASVAVHAASGDVSCESASHDAGFIPTPRAWSGLVTSSDATSIVIDTCAGATDAGADGGADDADAGAGCLVRVDALAPGLDLTRFPRVRVRVRAGVAKFYVCEQALEITTDVAGADAGAPGELLLAVVDGASAFDDGPYTVGHVALGCPRPPSCAGASVVPDTYAFDFGGPGAATIRVYQGETVPWTLGASTYAVQNLRSFQTCNFDDYWNWAYTIYADPK